MKIVECSRKVAIIIELFTRIRKTRLEYLFSYIKKGLTLTHNLINYFRICISILKEPAWIDAVDNKLNCFPTLIYV